MSRQQSFLPEVDDDAREKWRMNGEESFASFTFHPCIFNGETVYRYQESLEVKPYPNPLSFGGMWGSGGVKTREEVMEKKKSFFLFARRYERYGLVRFEEEELPLENWDKRARANHKSFEIRAAGITVRSNDQLKLEM